MTASSRRAFLKTLLGAIALIPFAGLLRPLFGADAPLPAGQTAIDENTNAVAKAIGYKDEVAKIDKKRKPARKDKQFCENCALFTKVDANWGRCQLMPVGLVKAKGWCFSYSKKA